MNGRLAYGNAVIEQWLRGNARTWRAADFRRPPETAETVPVWLSLYDADSFLYGGDDHADIHPGYRRHNVGIIYPLGTSSSRRPSAARRTPATRSPSTAIVPRSATGSRRSEPSRP